MSYTYGKRRKYYQNLKEDVAIAAQRVEYIKSVRAYRAEGRPIFYQDETWVNKNMTPSSVWLDAEGEGGFAVPQGKGERSIICHVGGRSGFVPRRSVIVIDRATYHTTLTDATKPARSTFKKLEFAEWLVAHGVECEGRKTTEKLMALTRPELAQLCKLNKPRPEYQIAVTAREFDCDVLILPVGHPELKPIEMVWGLRQRIRCEEKQHVFAC
ncbi:TPA: hypothetical protein N0F65_008509 [Lagenidium giganteum]|uniref:Transposase n=1 Tax=Lagenidium giganteum TaxID=4803 RepID=A0AAV2Z0L4_9STRA|nr:TPA: hypothetical protein N0F65_008509 [Lagenidium giganteum]